MCHNDLLYDREMEREGIDRIAMDKDIRKKQPFRPWLPI